MAERNGVRTVQCHKKLQCVKSVFVSFQYILLCWSVQSFDIHSHSTEIVIFQETIAKKNFCRHYIHK